MQELSALYEKTGQEVEDHYHSKFLEILEEVDLFEGPVPPEVWFGIAQAIADCSGYRLVLQAAILEPTEQPKTYRTVGHREVRSADSMVWVREVGQ
jgi:hypothetical protein